MWTMAHPSEEAAFEGYVAVFPSASILLIDTYDTLRGAERAARIARDKLKGVRLDSGDLLALSVAVRRILDEHGCPDAKIVASGDLNEYRIAELRQAGAPIDLYGVGTDLVTSIDAPSLGGVYKLVELERDGVRSPIAKFSAAKATLPGPHQVYRFRGRPPHRPRTRRGRPPEPRDRPPRLRARAAPRARDARRRAGRAARADGDDPRAGAAGARRAAAGPPGARGADAFVEGHRGDDLAAPQGSRRGGAGQVRARDPCMSGEAGR
jgi:nicotinate phosphoribosyltransferase